MFALRSLVRVQHAFSPKQPLTQATFGNADLSAAWVRTFPSGKGVGYSFLSPLPWTPQKGTLTFSPQVSRIAPYSSFATKGVNAVAMGRHEEPMEEVDEAFPTEDDHLAFLAGHARLPAGFLVGTRTFSFNPRELPSLDAQMTLSMLALENPNGTESWSAMFTKNAFPESKCF